MTNQLTTELKGYFKNESVKGDLLALLPDGNNREQVLNAQMKAINLEILENPALSKCTALSFISALNKALTLNVRIGKANREAYLIPHGNQAILRLGYQAYINKAHNELGLDLFFDTITQEEYDNGVVKHYDPINGVLELDTSLDKLSKLKTKDNIAYCYIIGRYKDGTQRVKIYSKEELEEKSKTNGGKLGNVWFSKERATDYAEMLKKAAVIAFCKTLPNSTIMELANYEYKTASEYKDVTPTQEHHNHLLSQMVDSEELNVEVDSVEDVELVEVNNETGEISEPDYSQRETVFDNPDFGQ